MSHSIDIPQEKQESHENLRQWLFQETVEYECCRQAIMEGLRAELKDERRELDRQKKDLERERRDFQRSQSIDERRMEKEKQLFQMKLNILKAELGKLAVEKQEVQIQRDSFFREQQRTEVSSEKCGMLFCGVKNELALKKRYKDLIKIFHPDNVAGDTGVIQEINREYEELKKAMLHNEEEGFTAW